MLVSALRKLGKPLPPALADYVADCFLHGHPKPNQRSKIRERDLYISIAVSRIERLGFTPTANKDAPSGRPSASGCWIVGQALRRIGPETLGIKAIEKAWTDSRSRHEAYFAGRVPIGLDGLLLLKGSTEAPPNL
jgi:hypothetical protein